MIKFLLDPNSIREKWRISGAIYRKNNRERIAAEKAAYYIANKEKILAKEAARHAANPEVKAKYYAANKEKLAANAAIYRQENKELFRAHSAKRRAIKRAAGGTFSVDDLNELLTLQRWKCACCKTSLKKGYNADHIVALKNGGSNDRLNIQLLCPTCNRQKNTKHPVDFMQSKGYLL